MPDLFHHNNLETKSYLNDQFSFGPLEDLIFDNLVEDIVITDFNQIWFHKNGRFHLHNKHFENSHYYSQFVHQICERCGFHLNLSQPEGSGFWNGLRVQALQFPICAQTFEICIRKQKYETWSLNSFVKNQWCTPRVKSQLEKLVREKANFLIIGPTGVGKTSLIKALINEIPVQERTIIIEDTLELKTSNSLSSHLSSQRYSANPFSLKDLLKFSLRMRPDRFVLGEIRNEEAKDFLLALSTGHSGSFASIHASNARQALHRLEILIQMSASNWKVSTIRDLIAQSLDILVVLENNNGKRKLKSLERMAGLEETGFLLEPVSLCAHI